MSNYKSYDISFNELCSYFTDSNIINNYYKNTKISYKGPDFTSIINEKPTSLGYFYNKDSSNIDISKFSIAKYIEKSGNFTISNSDIPSWCTKIRAVLVGAGGSGTPGTTGYNTYVAANNQNTFNRYTLIVFNPAKNRQNQNQQENSNSVVGASNNNSNRYEVNTARQIQTTVQITVQKQINIITNDTQTTGKGKAGGGGGGFIYLNDVDIVGKTLNVQGSGGGITLSTGTENSAIVTKGGDASGNDIGIAGTAIITNLSGVAHNGNPGTEGNDTTGGSKGSSKLVDISSLSYGNGGNGGNGGIAAVGSTITVNGGTDVSGNSSFCRIYFLTQ
jgi:hypothetical protein